MKTVVMLVVGLVLCSTTSSAQIPRTLFYQGVLSDSTGAPKPDGSYSFTFRLYEASSGGSAVGTQQQTLQVKRGLFYTVFDQLLNGLTIDHPYWFTVQVQNEAELSPRIPFTSVPYSISSIRADTARYALTVASNTGWSLTGNAGTVQGTNFIGTTDNIPFTIRVNNQQAGRISSTGPTFLGYQAGNSNTDPNIVGVGYHALFSNTTGTNNTACGYSALASNTTGFLNTAIGANALLSNTTGNYNTANGYNALSFNTTGAYNTANGLQALYSNTDGSFNTASGLSALYSNTTGVNNTANGYQALYYNTTGTYNTASGERALFSNTTGVTNTAIGTSALVSNTTGSDNTASGFDALHSNTTGDYNTASGGQALYSNTTGYSNTASGLNTLYANTTGFYNTASGSQALFSNTTGVRNTASGLSALNSNTIGVDNTASGYNALYSNTVGTYNNASGSQALFSNITGNDNTATGYQALYSNNGNCNTAYGFAALFSATVSSYNVAVGYNTGGALDNGVYNTFVGAGAIANGSGYNGGIAIGGLSTATGNGQARIGNSFTSSIGGYVDWTNISDGRYKKNVKEDVKGLDFIMKLRPITYNLDVSGISAKLNESRGGEVIAQLKTAMAEKDKMVQSGFIAQEVEQAAKELGYNFSGVDAPKNDKDFYGLRYAEFTVPLVKAVQELSKENTELTARVAALEAMVKSLAEDRSPTKQR